MAKVVRVGPATITYPMPYDVLYVWPCGCSLIHWSPVAQERVKDVADFQRVCRDHQEAPSNWENY